MSRPASPTPRIVESRRIREFLNRINRMVFGDNAMDEELRYRGSLDIFTNANGDFRAHFLRSLRDQITGQSELTEQQAEERSELGTTLFLSLEQKIRGDIEILSQELAKQERNPDHKIELPENTLTLEQIEEMFSDPADFAAHFNQYVDANEIINAPATNPFATDLNKYRYDLVSGWSKRHNFVRSLSDEFNKTTGQDNTKYYESVTNEIYRRLNPVEKRAIARSAEDYFNRLNYPGDYENDTDDVFNSYYLYHLILNYRTLFQVKLLNDINTRNQNNNITDLQFKFLDEDRDAFLEHFVAQFEVYVKNLDLGQDFDRHFAEDVVKSFVEEIAAIKIQAVYRGYQARKQFNKELKEKKEKQEQEKRQEQEFKKSLDEGYPKRLNRDSYVEILTNPQFIVKNRKLVATKSDNTHISKGLPYQIHGKDKADQNLAPFVNDNIQLLANGQSYVKYDLESGGIDAFNSDYSFACQKLKDSLLIDSEEKRSVLIKFDGTVEKPIIDAQGNQVMKAVKTEDGKIDMVAETEPEIHSHCVVHSYGRNVTKTFVSEEFINQHLHLPQEQLEKRRNELYEIISNSDQITQITDPQQRQDFIKQTIEATLREEAQERLQEAIDKSRQESQERLGNREEVFNAIRRSHGKKFLPSEGTRAALNHLHNAIGPDGISFTEGYDRIKKRTQKKVTFNMTSGSKINNIAYVAIPNTPLQVRVQVALEDDQAITSFVDGRRVTKIYPKGTVVIDKNSCVFKNSQGQYVAYSMSKGKNYIGNESNSFLEGDVRDWKKQYKKLDIMATAMIGEETSVAIKSKGKNIINASVHSASIYKPDGSKLVVEKKLPNTSSFSTMQDLIAFPEDKEFELLKITSFGFSDAVKKNFKLKVKLAKPPFEKMNKKGNVLIKNARGTEVEVIPGQPYIDDIVDNQGHSATDSDLKEYGLSKKEIKKLESAIPRAREENMLKKQEQEFLLAAENGDLAIVERILEDYQQRVQDAIASAKSITLQDKATEDSAISVQKLAAAGIISRTAPNIFATNNFNKGGLNALHLAARNGHGEIVKKLLAFGFDPLAQSGIRIETDKTIGCNALELVERDNRFSGAGPKWLRELKTKTQIAKNDLPNKKRYLPSLTGRGDNPPEKKTVPPLNQTFKYVEKQFDNNTIEADSSVTDPSLTVDQMIQDDLQTFQTNMAKIIKSDNHEVFKDIVERIIKSGDVEKFQAAVYQYKLYEIGLSDALKEGKKISHGRASHISPKVALSNLGNEIKAYLFESNEVEYLTQFETNKEIDETLKRAQDTAVDYPRESQKGILNLKDMKKILEQASKSKDYNSVSKLKPSTSPEKPSARSVSVAAEVFRE